MDEVRIWEAYVLDVAIYESIRRFNRNSPLIENLSRIFSQLCDTLQQVYNYGRCMHVFINPSMPEIDTLVLGRDKDAQYRRTSFLDRRSLFGDIKRIVGREDWLSSDIDVPSVRRVDGGDFVKLMHLLEVDDRVADTASGEAMIVPFDAGKLNLGLFILWGEGSKQRKRKRPDPAEITGQIAALYRSYCEFLDKEYQITSDHRDQDGILSCKRTYLPSFRAARWKRVAILFADIHSFTPFTELLRNIDTRTGRSGSSLQMILNRFFETMAGIVQDRRGRIDRFFGAGVLAVFGEHEDDPSQAGCSAVQVAQEMVREFSHLREEFYRMVFGDEYRYEFNESVDISLGVGIDYGTVLFDYLGDERHREYTVAGDHVNFARMLGYAACRYDSRLIRQRPQILISSTIYHCIESRLIKKDLTVLEIQSESRNYPYAVYGVDEEVQFAD